MNRHITNAIASIREQLAVLERELQRPPPMPGDPTVLTMTMDDFVNNEIAGTKHDLFFQRRFLLASPTTHGRPAGEKCPYKIVGEMPVSYFVWYHSDNFRFYQRVGVRMHQKLSDALAEYGITWSAKAAVDCASMDHAENSVGIKAIRTEEV